MADGGTGTSGGVTRCAWAVGPLLVAYHDLEWGTPTREAARVFEALSLTIFENGLSWALVFGRRAALRAAFRGFEPAAVAGLDVDEVLAADGVIRNRRKVAATIHNARCTLERPLEDLVWQDGKPTVARLKRAGYTMVGPVVVRSFLQSVGVDNGHVGGCFRGAVTRGSGTI